MSEHEASVESLIEVGRSVLRYRGEGDRVSEHVASVESLTEMGNTVLRYQRGGRSSE